MNNIKSEFTIKDLENFSGIKAHTIRIWEKRYQLFEPQRTDSNIRYYDIKNLKKLLNVSLLYNNGFKISKIADLSHEKIQLKVSEVAFKKGAEKSALNTLKIAMLNFDENLFNSTYNSLIAQSSFKEVFLNTLMPFLNEIGILWMVNSISPAHEHFIANLIKQKLYFNIEKLHLINVKNNAKTYVLYLPLNEIHELGLLFLHFELLLQGKHAIYLGQSVPIENLNDLKVTYNNLCYITNLTVEPAADKVVNYLNEVQTKVLHNTNHQLWAAGFKISQLDNPNTFSKQVKLFSSLESILNELTMKE